jgi:hypothetical protein
MLAALATVALTLLGFGGADDRLVLLPLGLGLLWLAAYRAQLSERFPQVANSTPDSIVVRRAPVPQPRRRTEMPPTPSSFAPSAAVAAARAKSSGRSLIREVSIGLPERTAPTKPKRRSRKRDTGEGGGKPTLGL